jgi:uncharacterized membrane protein YqjE
MNPSHEKEAPPLLENSNTSPPGPGTASATLVGALLSLMDSRLGLFRLESSEATRLLAQKAISTAIAFCCLIFAWILLLTAGIQIIADAGDWPWSGVAIAVAIAHLIVGILLSRPGKTRLDGLFKATRNEFQKDREWIENFSNKKSND